MYIDTHPALIGIAILIGIVWIACIIFTAWVIAGLIAAYAGLVGWEYQVIITLGIFGLIVK